MKIDKMFVSLLKRALILSAVFSSVIFSAWWLSAKFSSFPEQETAAQINQPNTNLQEKSQPDIEFLQGIEKPCDFRSENGLYKQPGAKKLYEFINAGYPKEIKLEEGVAVFNRFARCDEVGRTQPPLRTEEVVAAIRDWDCNKDRNFEDKTACPEFWKIAETGRLPKGALIDYSGGLSGYTTARGVKGFDVETWEISLSVRLNEYRNDLKDVPSFKHLIRLSYLSSKPAQMPLKLAK